MVIGLYALNFPLLNFNSLLLVKDFKSAGQEHSSGLKTDTSFMTQADIPFLAAKDITNTINPFTNTSLYYDKSTGVIISTAHKWESPDPVKYIWKIRHDEWLHVHDNIFNDRNWSTVNP
jgi:hypothetical protein